MLIQYVNHGSVKGVYNPSLYEKQADGSWEYEHSEWI